MAFEDAMPSLDNFSTFLTRCDYTKWREIAECLNVPGQTVNTISDNLGGNKLRDKKAFLVVLASWREKAPIRISDRKANWKNLRKSLSTFHDIVEAIDRIKQGWSEDASVNLCKCGKPLALRIKKKDSAKSLFMICPKARKNQCKGSYTTANRLLDPKLSPKVAGPFEQLHRILLMEGNIELVNFITLAPYLIKEGLLTGNEYQNITGRVGISPQDYFHIFITQFLLKPDKGNIVKRFVAALKNEKDHKGHEDLLKRIEDDRILKKEIDKEDKKTDGPSIEIDHVKQKRSDKRGNGKEGPIKWKRYAESETTKEGPSKKKKRLMKDRN